VSGEVFSGQSVRLGSERAPDAAALAPLAAGCGAFGKTGREPVRRAEFFIGFHFV
jgi:hypothetical protein